MKTHYTPVPLLAVFVGYDEEGNEILSNECKPKKKCGDSDWWFDRRTKMFRRYYTYHDELYGLQTVYEKCVGIPKNGNEQYIPEIFTKEDNQ